MTTPTRETGGDTVNRLMDKFQAMGDQLTRLYPQTEAVEDEIESLHASVEATLAEQARLVAETAAANQRQQELRVQMEQARGDLIQTQGNVAHATRTKEAAQRRLQILKKHMAEQQQQFLQDSKDFQQTCQELQNEAAAVGLNVDACVFRASCVANGLPILENEELDAMVDTDDVNQDPLTWTNINTDERDAYLVMRNRAQSAQQALHEAHANKQVVLDRYAVRHAKQATLQQQLERLQGDIADKEAELAKVQQKTRNAKTLQRNLETYGRTGQQQSNMTRHTSITPSPVVPRNTSTTTTLVQTQNQRAVTNPYSGSARANNNGNGSGSSNNTNNIPDAARRAELMSVVTGSSHWNRNNNRVRRDRQFGSTLHVAGGEATSTTTNDNDMSIATDMFDMDDDDDEDDDLLSYTPFGKRK